MFYRLQNIVRCQRRTISEYAKSFGYRVRKQEIPEPSINPFKIALCYGTAGLLMYDVILDRKLHYKTFIENRVEGKEYLKLVPWFNHFTPFTYPEVDKFLGQEQPEYGYEDPKLSSVMPGDAMRRMTFKENPEEWMKDDTSYIKK